MIQNETTDLPPRAAGLVRKMIGELNTLRREVDALRGNSVVEGKINAVRGSQSRLADKILGEVYTRTETLTTEEIEQRDASTLASALAAIPDTIELPATWTRPVDSVTVAADRVYAREINEITGTRVSTWTDVATGLLGTASSSRRYKDDIRPLDLTALSILSVEPKWYVYKAEKRKRDDPEYQDYRGDDYTVATEPGMLAEDLHDAGLGCFVVYDEDGKPDGIHYQMWVVALQKVVRDQQAQIDDLAKRLDVLERRGTAAPK